MPRKAQDATAKRKALYLKSLRATRGAVLRACALANVGDSTVYRWREKDPAFAKREAKVKATLDQELADKINNLTDFGAVIPDTDEQGNPIVTDPDELARSVKWAAGRKLEEFKPPKPEAPKTLHVGGNLTFLQGADLKDPKKLAAVERFIETGQWEIELDKQSDGGYAKDE